MMTPSALLRSFSPRGGDGATAPAKPDPRRPWVLAAPAAAAVALSLSACGKADLGPVWFPLKEGTSITYAITQTGEEAPAPEEWTLRVSAPATLDQVPVAVRHHSLGVSYYLRHDEQGVRRVATRMDIDEEPTPEKEPLWVLKAPYTVGTEWTTPTVPYLILRRNEYPRELRYSHRALMQWRIEAVDDSVTTPSGTHRPCLRVVGRAELNLYTDPVNGFTNVPLISREWYCQGVGLVKFEREEKVPPGFLTGGTLKAEAVR